MSTDCILRSISSLCVVTWKQSVEMEYAIEGAVESRSLRLATVMVDHRSGPFLRENSTDFWGRRLGSRAAAPFEAKPLLRQDVQVQASAVRVSPRVFESLGPRRG